MSTSRISLKMDIENISLGIDTAIPTGLIINELVTNCLKYAFKPDQDGEIMISLRALDDGENELIVRDNGIGMSAEEADGGVPCHSAEGMADAAWDDP